MGLEGAVKLGFRKELEEAFEALQPVLVIDYGDVNSTLAAALVAAKLHLPQAHVEAGLRSFDMEMPEEVNRRVADALADLCFATSVDAVDNLRREGVPADRIHLVGNSMIDSLEVVAAVVQTSMVLLTV